MAWFRSGHEHVQNDSCHTAATSSHEFTHNAHWASSRRPSLSATVLAASAPIDTTRPNPIRSSSQPHALPGNRAR